MTQTNFWVGTSWKMNKTLSEAMLFASKLRAADTDAHPQIQRFVIPPLTSVREVKAELKDSSVLVGAQNMHWADSGAWTGEVSPLMLTDCELDIVELGHSERRTHFGETNETVALKSASAVRNGLIPLICIGETLTEREAGNATAVLAEQVAQALTAIRNEKCDAPVLLAYEPVWAIGEGGIPASSDYANKRHAEIKALSKEILGNAVPCLYGGSVNLENCVEFIQCEHIDGLFIGRSAWNVEGYLDILHRCASAIQN